MDENKPTEEKVDKPEQTQPEAQPKKEVNTDALKKTVEEESKGEPAEKEMIKRVGQIKNENGEWVEYIEEDDPERPPIAYTYMGSQGLPIGDDDEVVDFCMQYRIPQIEGLEKCTNLKVSIQHNFLTIRFIGYLETGIEKKFNQKDRRHLELPSIDRVRAL